MTCVTDNNPCAICDHLIDHKYKRFTQTYAITNAGTHANNMIT